MLPDSLHKEGISQSGCFSEPKPDRPNPYLVIWNIKKITLNF
jgi:hypothetical protein